MAEKYLSTTGLTKLVEEMSSLTSSAINGMYGSIMGQMNAKMQNAMQNVQQTVNNGTTNTNSDSYYFTYPILFSDSFNKNGTTVSTHIGGAGIKSNFAYNPSREELSGVNRIVGDNGQILMDSEGVLALSGETIDMSGETIDMSGNVNVNSGVFSADNGNYLHMPNNESMLDLDEYKDGHSRWANANLKNTSDYTSTIISTTPNANSYSVFKTVTSQSAAVYNYTIPESVNFYMGTTISAASPQWIINPISNNDADVYVRKLSIPGPSITLTYTSGDAGTATGNVTTRLSLLTCTYKAKVYRQNTLIGTKELGTTGSISKSILQTMATGSSQILTLPSLLIDFSEQEWLEWIQTTSGTFTLKDWKDNISIIIIGDLNFARPSYGLSQVVNGFEFSIGSANIAKLYPSTEYKYAKPFYEGSKDGIRQYFNDANYFSMIPDQSTELYTPEFSISGNTYAAAFYETSDEKLKNFSNEIAVDFDKLKEIRKSYFTWKDGDGKMLIGTSAQDVQKVYPELVSENKDGNLTVDYAKLSLVALAAVDKLEERLAKIEKILNITE